MTFSNPPKRYIVTGASGHLGSAILRVLCEQDGEIFGLLLPGQEPKVIHPNIHYFYGDIRHLESLFPLFSEADDRDIFVIHTAAMISISKKMPKELHEVNVDGVKNMLRLCREYKVRRLVHVSSVHAIPELPDGQTIREVNRFSPDSVVGGYAKSKAEAAQAVLDAAADGLDAVLVFPSGILGPYDEGSNHLLQMILQYVRGKLPACVQGGYDFVDVRDVAKGCIAALEHGRKGEGYILSGHYFSIHELLATAGKFCRRKPVPALPISLATLALPFIELAAKIRKKRALYTAYSLHTLSGNGNFSCEKAERELHYTVRKMEETLRDTVSWLRKKTPKPLPLGSK